MLEQIERVLNMVRAKNKLLELVIETGALKQPQLLTAGTEDGVAVDGLRHKTNPRDGKFLDKLVIVYTVDCTPICTERK